MRIVREDAQLEQVLLSGDELKLIEKYREALGKLQPGEVSCGRYWSFPLIDSPGDSIYVSIAVSHRSHEPQMSEAEVVVERARSS